MSTAHGAKDQAVGAVKETVGNAVGNPSLQAEGKVQNASGTAERNVVAAKNAADGAASQVTGAVKQTVGAATGDSTMEVKGAAERKLGEAKTAANT